jgi:predicted AAA+ superfamily ATPase
MRTALLELLDHVPAVVLIGPRQVGKTTLALDIAATRPSAYVDLESPSGRARLADPELYLADHRDELVILDEVHRLPGLFQVLRGVVDQGRRSNRPNGRFLLLGSASVDLLRQSGETLAGRVAILELSPLDALEVEDTDDLWSRGGFPDSFLASDDAWSFRWRTDFIRTYLERDVPQLGFRIPAETLRRLWTMLAHGQGGLLNAANLARSLGVDAKTVARYIDLLVDLLLVHRLPPWTSNIGKRLVRSPKVYVRDSGLVHALLGLSDRDAILGHPIAGASWEGFVIENLLNCGARGIEAGFYRATGGAEVDLVLRLPRGATWLVEIKRTLAPSVGRGFWSAWSDLEPTRGFVVYPGAERFRLKDKVEAVNIADLAKELAAQQV